MMVLDRLTSLIDAYGADPERWPADERAAALLLLANSPAARAYAREAEALDALLDRVPLRPTVTVDPATMAAQIARTPRHQPAAVRRLVGGRMGFGWPNFAALAAAGIVGFMIGWTDLNSSGAAAVNRDVVDAISPVSSVDDSVW